MNSAKFNPAEHHHKQHGAAEADDKITEVLSPKIALSAASQPKDAAIFVQNPGGKVIAHPLGGDHADCIIGRPASAARRAWSAVSPCNRPVAITVAAAA